MRTSKIVLIFMLAAGLSVPSCEPDKKMLVETGEASNISTTTADVSGTVVDVGEGATQHGHCYGTSAIPTISGSKTSLGIAATGDFTSNLTGLEPSTTYYIRAYTSLGAEAAYGNEINFTTASAALPELTTAAITSITKTSAVSGGNITSEGGTAVTARGVCWNVASGPTVALTTKTTDGEGSGSFASSITGLSANTVYYVRAYATNAGGTAYGNEISFTTSPEVAVAPVVTTAEVTSVTSNSAISGGDVTNEGGAPVTAKGVCWSTTANPTITSSKTTDGTGSGSFVSSITNLNPGTTYYVRAYATNSAGTSYGNEYNFTTEIVIPTISTIAITSITSTAAVSGGNITKDGGSAVTVRGVCWSTSQNPTTADGHTSDGTGSGTYSSNITGLSGNTTYYVRAYATNSAGTAYGNELSFNTGAVVPTLTTTAVTSITSTTATSGGEISSDGGSSITAKGVCWSTSANPTTADSKTSDGTGTDPFTSSITGLTSGTIYHVRAYAINSVGTAYGNDISFTTSTVIPTVTTYAITNITSTTATSGGIVSSDGGAAVTARGVCWSATADPTTADSKTSDGTGTGSYASSITGLTPGETFHVRAYAINSVGTAYGADLTFTAGAVLATVTTSVVTNIASTTANSGGDVTSDGGSSVTVKGICWSTSANPTISNSKTTDGSGTGIFTSTLTGLTPNTAYYVRAYATNSSGTSYGSPDIIFTSLATVTTDAISQISTTSASCGGTVTIGGSENISARGVCWSTSPNPTVADNKTTDGTGTGNFTSNLTGLNSNTKYYVRAYATNAGGTAYGDTNIIFTSLASMTTTAISDITFNSATGGGTVAAGGGESITARGVCWSTSPNPTPDGSGAETHDGTGVGSFVSSITGLTPNTPYYVRAYSINGGGIAYGNEVTFTTYNIIPTLTTEVVSSITFNSAVSGGNITYIGGSAITQRGVCWSENPNPDLTDSWTSIGSGEGNYTSNITGLNQGTLYYLKAYATNSYGTGYGNEVQFITLNPPIVSTAPPTLITTVRATMNGLVNAKNNSTTVTFEYGQTTAYGSVVTANESPVAGNSDIPVSAVITNLTPGTEYHYRLKAVSSQGTTYSNDANFLTVSATVTDIDGNVYNTVSIGTQVWLRENLRVKHFNNSEPSGYLSYKEILSQWISGLQAIVNAGGGGILWIDATTVGLTVEQINQGKSLAISFGVPYNDTFTIAMMLTVFQAIHDAISDTFGYHYIWSDATDARNLCPSGWHLPSDVDWTTLISNLGGEIVAGGKLKEIGTEYWESPNTGATNESDFTALPEGKTSSGNLSNWRTDGFWWSSTSYDTDHAWSRSMNYDYAGVYRISESKTSSLSVRCVKD